MGQSALAIEEILLLTTLQSLRVDVLVSLYRSSSNFKVLCIIFTCETQQPSPFKLDGMIMIKLRVNRPIMASVKYFHIFLWTAVVCNTNYIIIEG